MCAGKWPRTRVSPHRRARREIAEAAWAHSVHAEPVGLAPGPLVLVPLHRARRAQRVGRTRTAPAPARTASSTSPSPAASATSRPLRRLAPCRGRGRSTWCSSSATTSTSTRRGRCAAAHRRRARGRWPTTGPATPPTRATRCCRPRTPQAVAAGLGRPRGRATTTPDLQRRAPGARLRRPARRRLPRLLGAHAVPAVGATAPAPTCASPAGWTGVGWRASTCSTIASTAIRRPARAGPRRLEHRRARATARRSPTPSAACSAPRRSAGSPKAGTCRGRGTCWRSRP